MIDNNNELLIKTGEILYGQRWQTEIARDLGFADGRRVRQWLANERPIPVNLKFDLLALLKEREANIKTLISTASS